MNTHPRTDATSTVPPSITTTPADSEVVWFDTTLLLVDDGVASAPSVVCLCLDTGSVVVLPDVPTLADPYILQRVSGLTAGMTYRLRATFATNGNTRTMTTIVYCV